MALALQDALQQIHIESTFEQVLSLARRTLPDGSPDPNDRSQKQPDLAVFDTHHGGPLPTLDPTDRFVTLVLTRYSCLDLPTTGSRSK